ncbi:MAG TPA: diaminopimelate epimerase [Bacteroidota bacterium]|nr:diaminopimelate epimerase [Bacteroidota bacterium]
MSGAGNDFVVIDNRSHRIRNGASIAQRLCDRRWGVGADGLILIEKSRKAAFRMMYFNADGSYGGMCGNGGRCAALYAFSHGIAPRQHKFEAVKHIYAAFVKKQEVVLEMTPPHDMRVNEMLKTSRGNAGSSFINTGSPHVVIPVENLGRGSDLETLDVLGLGKEIRYNPAFGVEGANVNFIERIDAKSLRMRTYERGVEDETLACGTGSVASALVASRLWGMKTPVKVIARSGKTLRIEFNQMDGDFVDVKLIGPAKTVFHGVVQL